MSYIVGETIEIALTITDSASGQLVDPDTLDAVITAPDATQSAGTVTRTGPGLYTLSFEPTAAGRWYWRLDTTGQGEGADQGFIDVDVSYAVAQTAEDRARATLARMLAVDMEPTLTGEDVQELLDSARRPDADCNVPSDAAWVPTFDLDAAAADGWERKAALAAGAFNFAEDGQQFSRSQVFAQCMAMAKLYRRGTGSARLTSGAVRDDLQAAYLGIIPEQSVDEVL